MIINIILVIQIKTMMAAHFGWSSSLKSSRSSQLLTSVANCFEHSSIAIEAAAATLPVSAKFAWFGFDQIFWHGLSSISFILILIYWIILTTWVSYVCVKGQVVSFVLSEGNLSLVKQKLRGTRAQSVWIDQRLFLEETRCQRELVGMWQLTQIAAIFHQSVTHAQLFWSKVNTEPTFCTWPSELGQVMCSSTILTTK